VDPRSYYEACRWDYCQCSNSNREDCACSALETYFHECLRHNVELPDGWRSPSLCRKFVALFTVVRFLAPEISDFVIIGCVSFFVPLNCHFSAIAVCSHWLSERPCLQNVRSNQRWNMLQSRYGRARQTDRFVYRRMLLPQRLCSTQGPMHPTFRMPMHVAPEDVPTGWTSAQWLQHLVSFLKIFPACLTQWTNKKLTDNFPLMNDSPF
jgi:hypothetical protein